MTKTKYRHQTETGEIDTRTSAREYTHVVLCKRGDNLSDWEKSVGRYAGEVFVARWSGNLNNASKAIAEFTKYGAYEKVWVEKINGGTR